MRFDVMLQSLINRCEVTGPDAFIPLDGCRFDPESRRWLIDVDNLEHLRGLVGNLPVTLQFEPDGSPDLSVLIVEDDSG